MAIGEEKLEWMESLHIHTKINQDFLLHRQNQKFKGLLCTVDILQKTVKLRN